jgi:hypothetical protein
VNHHQLFDHLIERGFILSIEGTGLGVAPVDKLTIELKKLIIEHKTGLLSCLSKKTNTLKFDELMKRIETLRGIFYDDEDAVFARRWLQSGHDATELETLITDAEKQVSQSRKPQTI